MCNIRVNLNGNHEPWVIVACQCRLIAHKIWATGGECGEWETV